MSNSNTIAKKMVESMEIKQEIAERLGFRPKYLIEGAEFEIVLKVLKALVLVLFLGCNLFAQDTTKVDTVAITSPVYLEILPKLLQENAQLVAQIKNNNEKIMLIISAYADPRKFKGITQDLKHIIIER